MKFIKLFCACLALLAFVFLDASADTKPSQPYSSLSEAMSAAKNNQQKTPPKDIEKPAENVADSANTKSSASASASTNAKSSANANVSSNAKPSANANVSANTKSSANANVSANADAATGTKASPSGAAPVDAAVGETIILTDTTEAKADTTTKIKPFVTFNYGASATWVTRIKKQTGRSNFVYNDFLAGLYFTTELRKLAFFDIMLRVAAYYPLSYTFNKVPQTIAQPLAFGFDGFLGINFKFSIFDKLYIDLAPGAHVLYQMSDRFNFIDLGVAAMLGLEFPISPRWTILMNGYASLDYGNLGTNMHMEPYDIVWQYQTSFGVRYSKRAQNPNPYIKPRKQRGS